MKKNHTTEYVQQNEGNDIISSNERYFIIRYAREIIITQIILKTTILFLSTTEERTFYETYTAIIIIC